MADDYLKYIAFLGLGVFSETREKIETRIEKLVEKGELSAAQGKKLAKRLLDAADRRRIEIKKRVDEGVKSALARAGVARSKEVETLNRRIDALEKRLAAYEVKKGSKKVQR